jgi:hypothetical protein
MTREEAINEALFAARLVHHKSEKKLSNLINKIYDQQEEAKFIAQMKRVSSLLVPQKTLEEANNLIDAVFMIIAEAIENSEDRKLQNKGRQIKWDTYSSV